MTINSIVNWHKVSRPTPDQKAFNVQLGCHLEEIWEMLDTMTSEDKYIEQIDAVRIPLKRLADNLKRGMFNVTLLDRRDFIDSLADQVVTAAGVAHCADMDLPKALLAVNKSNWSKFVYGVPVFDENGKIAKPSTYHPPNLDGCY